MSIIPTKQTIFNFDEKTLIWFKNLTKKNKIASFFQNLWPNSYRKKKLKDQLDIFERKYESKE